MSSSLKIYTDFFGLEKRPFTLLPDPDFIYWSTPHKQAYTMLEYGMLTCAPITLITGEIGAGKTTLLRELLKQIPQEYSTFLVDNYAQGKRTVLIFDEAQNLSIETLEELRMFSNINADTDELLQLILVGQPQLCDLVSHPKLVQFAQRIAAEFHLPTMTAEEVEDYINHRLEVAGATTKIFTKGACESIHLVSKSMVCSTQPARVKRRLTQAAPYNMMSLPRNLLSTYTGMRASGPTTEQQYNLESAVLIGHSRAKV